MKVRVLSDRSALTLAYPASGRGGTSYRHSAGNEVTDYLSALRFSFFRASNRAQCIDRDDPPNRAGSEARLSHFPVRINDEICRVNNFPSIFPIRSNLVGVFRNF